MSENKLQEIMEVYRNIEYLKARKGAESKRFDGEIKGARDELKRLVESPVPDTTGKRADLLRQIREEYDRERQIMADRKSALREVRKELREAEQYLDELIKGSNQEVLPLGEGSGKEKAADAGMP